MTEQFVGQTETDLGVDRIITSPTGYALYENVLAFMRGAPTARAKVALSPWATVPTDAITPGDVVRYQDLSSPAINAWQEQAKAASVMVFCSGTVRVTFIQAKVVAAGSPGDVNASVRRLRGTTEATIDSFDTNGSSLREVDVSVEPGDSIILTHRGRAGGFPTDVGISKLSLFRVSVASGSPHFWCVGPGSLLMATEPV